MPDNASEDDGYEPFSIEKLAKLFPDGTAKDQWSFTKLIPLIRQMIPAIDSDLECVQKYPVYHEDLNGLITKCFQAQVSPLITPIVEENKRLNAELTTVKAQIRELQERQKRYDEASATLQALRDEVTALKATTVKLPTNTVATGGLVPQPSGFRSTTTTPVDTPVKGSPSNEVSQASTPDCKVSPPCFDETPLSGPATKESWTTIVKKGKVVRGTREKASNASNDIIMSTLQLKRVSKTDKEREKKDFCLHGIPPLEQTEHQTPDDYSRDLKATIESIGISVRFVSIYSAKKGRKNSLFARVGSYASESEKMFTADNWPPNIGVREWQFTPKEQ